MSMGQSEQRFPPEPQSAELVPGKHVEPLQQPVGQDVESHVQTPPTQACPLPHAAAAPQVQTPATHAFVVAAGQVVQVAPPIPHALTDVLITQEFPLQQPVQLEASQTQPTPETQC